jgi:hypothetical protein
MAATMKDVYGGLIVIYDINNPPKAKTVGRVCNGGGREKGRQRGEGQEDRRGERSQRRCVSLCSHR